MKYPAATLSRLSPISQAAPKLANNKAKVPTVPIIRAEAKLERTPAVFSEAFKTPMFQRASK